MSIYSVTVQRTCTVYEEAWIEVEADTPEAALAKAREEHESEGFDWRDFGGSTDPASYEWQVRGIDTPHGAPMVIAEGRFADEETAS